MSALGLRFYTHEGDRDALRDQFALHAPPVPDWFDVPMPARPVEGAGALERWRKLRAINRLTQWPWHYADLVLAERDVVQARGEQR